MRASAPLAILAALALTSVAVAQPIPNDKLGQRDKFRQLAELLPTPNERRLASGAPGPKYWQQRVDYVIDVTLDDANQRLIGSEQISYHNRSPHTLSYLWVQLDPNLFKPNSKAVKIQTGGPGPINRMHLARMRYFHERARFDGGVKLSGVSHKGKPLEHKVIETMMRVHLPRPLEPGKRFVFKIGWSYRVNDTSVIGGRTGFETLEDGNRLYEIAQWFPRMAHYSDVRGWHHKQYQGRGEFALEFGDYVIRITAPEDFVVTSTGKLHNAEAVLTPTQRERLKAAATADKPQFVITPEEAKANRPSRAKGSKTWIFKADNVRDCAWAASRAFIWDAWGVKIGAEAKAKTVMAMSFYPQEGEPLWSRYSTQAVAHTLEEYSKFLIDYPYPVAISVNGPVGGMEYPMICFNGPRPAKDGTYSKRTKYGLISVVIHEVGHNWFPMIINSDEREWTWMDEGLNTFVQYLAQCSWEKRYPHRRGEPSSMIMHMVRKDQVPIMTHSQSLRQFGANAYGKPAAALNVLRETVLGRENFDFALKTYAQRWAFKHPEPADFFRTMEDAAGVDLDWFWRGWFYTTDHTDIGILRVHAHRPGSPNPQVTKDRERELDKTRQRSIAELRNEKIPVRTERFKDLIDFYNTHDPHAVTRSERERYARFLRGLQKHEEEILRLDRYYYVVELQNKGGLVMPVILRLFFEDGSDEVRRHPAEVWRHDNVRINLMLITTKPVKRFELDPFKETADAELEDNHFPRRMVLTPFEVYKAERRDRNHNNTMQRVKKEAREAKRDEEKRRAREKAAREKGAKKQPQGQKPEAKDPQAPPKPRDSGAGK